MATINLADEGLQDGDFIDPYIDEHFDDGNEVHVPSGTYETDVTWLQRTVRNASLVGSRDGVELVRRDDPLRGSGSDCSEFCNRLKFDGHVVIENITIRGKLGQPRARWLDPEGLSSDAVLELRNFNVPDGTLGCSDSYFGRVYGQGEVRYRWCFIGPHANATFYQISSGRECRQVFEGCVLYNNAMVWRGGTRDYTVRDCLYYHDDYAPAWAEQGSDSDPDSSSCRQRPGRAVKMDQGYSFDGRFENVHFVYQGDCPGIGLGIFDFQPDQPDTTGVMDGIYIYNEVEPDDSDREFDHRDGAYLDGWEIRNVHITGAWGKDSINMNVDHAEVVDDPDEPVRELPPVWTPGGEGMPLVADGGLDPNKPGDTFINLADEGLEDGDFISPYIADFWAPGTQVYIPPGDYTYDGSGIRGTRSNCSLIGSEDGVRFHRVDEGDADKIQIAPNINCDGGEMRVENITVRGKANDGPDQSRWRFGALHPDSYIWVVNVNHPDGTLDATDSSAFLVYDDHRGTVHFKNCYISTFGNSGFYVNLGYRSGESNPVIIDNCVIKDVNGAIRGGHNDSKVVDTTFIFENQPPTWHRGGSIARGIRSDHGGHDMEYRNLHFYYASGLNAGAAIDPQSQGADTSGHVADIYVYTEGDYGDVIDRSPDWTYENIHISGPGSASSPATAGSEEPDLKNRDVVWMPESQTVRPGDGQDAPSPDLDSLVVNSISDEDFNYVLEFEGHVEGDPDFDGNETVTESGGVVTIEGRTGSGFDDSFLVDGELVSFEIVSVDSGNDLVYGEDYELLLNGEQVDMSNDGGYGGGKSTEEINALIDERLVMHGLIRDPDAPDPPYAPDTTCNGLTSSGEACQLSYNWGREEPVDVNPGRCRYHKDQEV